MAFRIMIVSDDQKQFPLFRELIRSLSLEVAEPMCADDLRSAFVHLGALDRAVWPDLILLDASMSATSDWSFLESLRLHPKYNGIKIAMMTSGEADHSEADAKALVARYGADGSLAKPVTVTALTALIDEVFACG